MKASTAARLNVLLAAMWEPSGAEDSAGRAEAEQPTTEAALRVRAIPHCHQFSRGEFSIARLKLSILGTDQLSGRTSSRNSDSCPLTGSAM